MVRKVIFWMHLGAGVVAGLVILVMSVTGVLLTYEKQMIEWADRRALAAAPAVAEGAARLPADELLAKVVAAAGSEGGAPTSLRVGSDPRAPVAVGFGRAKTVYVDPYTGTVLGEGSAGTRAFFRVVTDWHRWLATSGDYRATGRAVTGACNLAFLFLVVSGVYLWWPRVWRWSAVRAVTLFRGGLSGKAREWNWHNVIGFWCAAPLAVVVASAAVISYPWASDLVYRAAGEAPPPRRTGPAPAGASAGGGGERRAEGERRGPRRDGSGEEGRGGRGEGAGRSAIYAGLDAGFAAAGAQAPGWRTVSVQLPQSGGAPLVFTVDGGTGGQPQKRGQATYDRAAGAVTKWEPFASQSAGRRWRSILRFAHTGEVAGILGQTIAGVASAGAAVLVYTGFALTCRRFFGGRRGRGSRVGVQDGAAPEAAGVSG